MVKTKNSHSTEIAVSNGYQPSSKVSLESHLGNFVKALGEVLEDITALEVNTMVCERITGDKFIPWETYRNVYPINREYLQEQGIHESLRDRYLELRRNLELEYSILVTDPNSDFYNSNLVGNLPILTNPNLEIDQIQTILPDALQPTSPDEILKVQRLLGNSRFLRVLRKIGELKAALDNRNQALYRKELELAEKNVPNLAAQVVKTDIIYAQTVIQLDGDIINRFSEELLEHPQKDLILKIHREGVLGGEQQWRGLLGFVVDLVQKAIGKATTGSLFPPR
ncbi:MAG: hypothetical protein SAJ37_21965 [Oscillatoria sp. PMC 1068.18]|nr:hypothetical protein [Oscillatoria sp. PMC 1076.18]MEC4991410.1 hypothetical protein [Oscillatoria sp. PMC 1068.18]